jgi:AraC-like DNA-binding protein
MHLGTGVSLFRLSPPYTSLEAFLPRGRPTPRAERREDGSFLVWRMGAEDLDRSAALYDVSRRTPGVSLVVILPPAEAWPRNPRDAFELILETRPSRVLPHQRVPAPGDLVDLMREGPGSIPAEVLDYVGWRGIWLERETRAILSRIGDLSDEVTTMAGVARGLYMSRRSVGRRFQTQGLPSPSQWLKMFRVLRACILLQQTRLTLHDVARCLHYPDAFTLSNQMSRMAGVRAEGIRSRVGWEWVVEAWIRREEAKGFFGLQFPIGAGPSPLGGVEAGQ